MMQDLAHDLCLGNGGNDSQGPLLTHRTAFHIKAKHSLEQLAPAPARRGATGLWLRYALLARRGDDHDA